MTRRGEHVRRGAAATLATCVLTSAAALAAPRTGFDPTMCATLPLLAEHALGSVVAEVLGQLAVDQRSQTLTQLSARLLDVDAAELDVAASTQVEGRTVDETDVVLAIALRAGRPVPPGLSAARRTQRETRATEALDWLRAKRETETGRRLVEEALQAALDPLDPRMPAIPELLVACSHVVADLELVEFAPAVARLLGDSATDVRGAARAALFHLYGRRFDDLPAFAARWPELQGLTPAATGRDEIRAAVDLSNERALQLLELLPAQFEESPLDWSDPGMPPRAARSIGRAVASGVLAPATARAWLVEGIAEVESPAELHARLGVLLDLAQGADPASPAVTEVRDAVRGVVEAAAAGAPEIVFVALTALPRVPFVEGADGDAERVGLARSGALAFDRALTGRRMRPLDPDALQGAILALRDVLRGVEDVAARKALVEPFALLLREIVADVSEPVAVRRAAATSLSISTSKTAANALVEILGAGQAVEVEYELLGALRSAVQSLEPGDEEAEQLLRTLFASLRDADFDRRARALELLLSDELADVLAAEARPAQARFAVQQLPVEETPELRAQLLQFVGRTGDADVLKRLLETSELVEDLADGGDEVARALVEAARSLVDEEARIPTMLQVASRMAGPLGGDEDELAPARVARVRAALDIVLALDESEARALTRADHRWTLEAAIDLHRSKDLLAPALLDSVHRVRLVEVHAQALEVPGDEERDPVRVALTRALFGSDEVLAQLEALDAATPEPASARAERASAIDRAVSAFDAAIAEPVKAARFGWTSRQLRLECIEFLRASGRESAALGRLVVLFSEDDFHAAEAPSHVIRMFAELSISSGPGADPERARSVLAADAVHGLVARQGWRNESVTVRLQDLSALTELVSRAANPARCERSIALLTRQLVSDDEDAVVLREEFAREDPVKLDDLVKRVQRLVRGDAPGDEPGETPDAGGGDGETAGDGDAKGGDEEPPKETTGTGGGDTSASTRP